MEIDRRAIAALPWELRAEIEENLCRKDFLPSEIAQVERACQAILEQQARERQGTAGPTSGKGAKPNGSRNLSLTAPGRTSDKIGSLFGLSGRTLEKIAAVCEAAEAEPERFGKLAEDMDRNGRVNGPFKRLCNMRDAERIRAEPSPLPNGQWRVGVVDVGWPSEPDDPDPAPRGYWPFATMSLEAVAALKIGELFLENAVLWFWATSFHMRFAYPILEAWGFDQAPAILTWDKGRPGRGQRLLGQTEHCIMGLRGKPTTTLTNQTTLLRARAPKPLGRKPPEFYAMVEALCPAPGYLDIFSRYRHNDKWTC